MKKTGKKWLMVVFGICILIGIAVPVALSQNARARAQEDEELTLFADIIVVKYREAEGKLQYRRWNETKGVWVDEDWIDLTESAGVPTPTRGADLTGIPGVSGLKNTPKPTPTSAPTPSPLPTATPRPTTSEGWQAATPLPTAMPEQEVGKEDLSVDQVPIDAAHFGGESFLEYLKQFDQNGDGRLSLAERNLVTKIDYVHSEVSLEYRKQHSIELSIGEVRGFAWFPNLDSIHIVHATSVTIKDVPSLKRVSFGTTHEEGKTDEVLIENCPALEEIRGNEGPVGRIVIRNCENLRHLFADETAEIEEVICENTPKLLIDTNGNVMADAGVFVAFYEETDGAAGWDAVGKRLEQKGSSLQFTANQVEWGNARRNITWNQVSSDAMLLSDDSLLQTYFDTQSFEGLYSFEIWENQALQTTELGRYHCIVSYGKEPTRKESFTVPTTQKPEMGDFYLKADAAKEITLLAYSPEHGVLLRVLPEVSLYYRSEDGDVCIGTFDKLPVEKQYVGIRKNQTVAFPSYKELREEFGLATSIYYRA